MVDRVEVAEVISDGVAAHPAAIAWLASGGQLPPLEIRVLKERSKGVRKSAVYWLRGAGPVGETVIAKMSKRQAAALETLIYSEILPAIGVDAPVFHGALDEGGQFSWMFLEYVEGERYSTRRANHRRLVGGWLAELHAASSAATRGALPDRGPAHFLAWLREGRAKLAASSDWPQLTSDEAALAERLCRSLDVLEEYWEQVVALAGLLPPTLVHGDLVHKNIVVRDRAGAPAVAAFDWEKAGWGPPAIDLAQLPESHRFAANACLDAYHSGLKRRGVDVPPEAVRRSAALGTVFRCVAGIFWSGLSLVPHWVHHPMMFMNLYHRWLEQAMAAARIGPDHE